jgi:hypothetical protein
LPLRLSGGSSAHSREVYRLVEPGVQKSYAGDWRERRMTQDVAHDPVVVILLTEAVVIAVVSLAIVGFLAFRAGARALSKPRH